jgi:hypothetical protein
MVPVVRGRFLKRVRYIVGVRDGYLVVISPSHALRASFVDILVRFPQHSTVRGFSDDVLSDPALAAAFGRKKRVPRSWRKAFVFGDGAVLLRIAYAVIPPRPARVERLTKGLVEAISHHMRPLEQVCEICAESREPSVYLADGVPAYVCDRCVVDYRQRELDFADMLRHVEPELGRGTALGAGAAFAFGLVAGALAAVLKIKVPSATAGFYSTLPIFGALGYATSLIASRGFSGRDLRSSLLKAPLALLATFVAFTTSNTVKAMTDLPQPLSLGLLWGASYAAIRFNLWRAAACAAAGLVGWMVELVMDRRSVRRAARPTEIISVGIEE